MYENCWRHNFSSPKRKKLISIKTRHKLKTQRINFKEPILMKFNTDAGSQGILLHGNIETVFLHVLSNTHQKLKLNFVKQTLNTVTSK